MKRYQWTLKDEVLSLPCRGLDNDAIETMQAAQEAFVCARNLSHTHHSCRT